MAPTILLIFLHLVQGNTVQIPLGIATKNFTCHQALEKVATFDETNGVFYKGKRIFMYYCKDEDGQWIP
jgi:hypothetical protein